ncbi:MAG: HAD family hydrolase [Gemmatimonadota bacterium]|nr:MAG: HAD family hydrolase [Gemmatimonadota bacterium]
MSSVRDLTDSRLGGLPSDLLEQLVKAATKASTAPQAIAALAELDPSEAVAWLLVNEQLARALCPAGELGKLVDTVVRASLGDSNGARVSNLAQLASRYADIVGADTVAALAVELPYEKPGAGVKETLARVLERQPGHAGLLRAAVDRALRGHDSAEAHRLLTELGRADDSQATLHYIWRRRGSLQPSGGPPVRVAFMSSFTVDPLAHYLDLECRGLGLEPEIYVTPFNSWAQEIIGEDSGLRRFDPEVAFLSVAIDDLITETSGSPAQAQLDEAGATAVGRILAAASQFSDWSDGVLVVHGFHSAFADPYGILGGRAGKSRSAWLADLDAELAEGLSRFPRAFLLNMAEIFARRPGGSYDNPKMRHMASMRLCGPVVGEVARAYTRYIAPAKGLTRKCVVLDLDNTLWGGIVGEDGPHGIRLGGTSPGSEYQEFQRFLLSLTERGFLLAINSKNNPEDALEVVRSHEAMVLREDVFSAMRINWLPKPENMKSLAEELNIGIDSLIFIDDNPNERAIMRQALPQVLVPEMPNDPSLYRSTVEALPQLQKLTVTEEDRTRTQLYRAKRQRDQTRLGAGSLDEYLESLEIAVSIGQVDEASLARVHQLFQRTNQFNLTTRRYTAGELGAVARDPTCRLYALKARDRFGDHGLVATALVRTENGTWIVDSFLMSCRVIGYGVETALLATLSEDARAAGAKELIGEYIETAKNAPARDFYPRHGFTELGAQGQATRWQRSLADELTVPPKWIRLEVS